MLSESVNIIAYENQNVEVSVTCRIESPMKDLRKERFGLFLKPDEPAMLYEPDKPMTVEIIYVMLDEVNILSQLPSSVVAEIEASIRQNLANTEIDDQNSLDRLDMVGENELFECDTEEIENLVPFELCGYCIDDAESINEVDQEATVNHNIRLVYGPKLESQIGQDIIDELEKRISLHGNIITNYKSYFEQIISISEEYIASLCKIPILIETADFANTIQKDFLNSSYSGVSIEAHYIAQKEVYHQIDKGKKLINEIEQATIKLNDFIADRNKGDREFLNLVESRLVGQNGQA